MRQTENQMEITFTSLFEGIKEGVLPESLAKDMLSATEVMYDFLSKLQSKEIVDLSVEKTAIISTSIFDLQNFLPKAVLDKSIKDIVKTFILICHNFNGNIINIPELYNEEKTKEITEALNTISSILKNKIEDDNNTIINELLRFIVNKNDYFPTYLNITIKENLEKIKEEEEISWEQIKDVLNQILIVITNIPITETLRDFVVNFVATLDTYNEKYNKDEELKVHINQKVLIIVRVIRMHYSVVEAIDVIKVLINKVETLSHTSFNPTDVSKMYLKSLDKEIEQSG